MTACLVFDTINNLSQKFHSVNVKKCETKAGNKTIDAENMKNHISINAELMRIYKKPIILNNLEEQ